MQSKDLSAIWRKSFRNVAEIKSITTKETSYKLDKPVPINIELAGNLEGASLRVTITDTHKRLIWSSNVPVKQRISLRADVSNALTIQCEVRATLTRREAVLADHAMKLLVRQPQAEAG